MSLLESYDGAAKDDGRKVMRPRHGLPADGMDRRRSGSTPIPAPAGSRPTGMLGDEEYVVYPPRNFRGRTNSDGATAARVGMLGEPVAAAPRPRSRGSTPGTSPALRPLGYGALPTDEDVSAHAPRHPPVLALTPALEGDERHGSSKEGSKASSEHAFEEVAVPPHALEAGLGRDDSGGDGGGGDGGADVLGPLEWSGRFAGGLRADLKRRAPYYVSDWTDAFKRENLPIVSSSTIFLFFACLAPAITFGALFQEETRGELGVVEMILSSGLSGVFYALFAGQPLCILGATGPELAYTVVFYQLCNALGLEFMPCRVWQGLWTALMTLALALTDSCALMRHVTRFAEETFSALITLIFVVNALVAICVTPYVRATLPDADPARLSATAALLTTLLGLGTYVGATKLKDLRPTAWFSPGVRATLANYSVTLAIVATSVTAGALVGALGVSDLPFLQVPSEFRPTANDPTDPSVPRAWLINPFGVSRPFPWWGVLFAAVPALGLTVLGYLDQNLTSILINRKDRKLAKPPAYHLDLLVCAVCIYPLFALVGLQFTHAATVRSLTHALAVTEYELITLADGKTVVKRPKRVVEQRVTQLAIHLLILLSLAATPLLRLIPKAVLSGVFLFMGVGSMAGNELFDRMFLFGIWERKEWPQYDYLAKVSDRTTLSFSAFQLGCLLAIYVVLRLPGVGVAFPFLIALLIPLRKQLHRLWDSDELAALDH